MAKSNFIVRGGADFNGLYKGFNTAQKRMGTFQSSMNSTMRRVGAIIGAVATGKLIKDSTKMAMAVESAMDNISRNMGNSSTAFNNWAQTQSKALGMARADAYKYGSTFSNLIGVFAKDTQETAQYTEDLMKAAAIISSKTGRTYDDTANRIRSGMLGSTEAIEDLGVYTNVSIMRTTEAFKKFANGKSWAQLDFQTQQQIRLAAILEQTYARYGDTLADTTQTRQARFIASLKNIQLNLGQAFLPIYNAVLPPLTALASKLEAVTANLRYFMEAIFGKTIAGPVAQTEEQATAIAGVGDAAETTGNQVAAAAKKAKKSIAGFDEINQLSKADSGGGGGGFTAETTLPEIGNGEGALSAVSAKVQETADKIKGAFQTIKNAVTENKNIILPAIGAIGGAFAGLAAYAVVTKLVTAIKGLGVAAKAAWAVLTANPVMLVFAAIGALVGGLIVAYKTNDEFRATVDKLWDRIKTALTPAVEALGKMLKWLWESVIVPLGRIVIDVLVFAVNTLTSVFKWLWEFVLVPLGRFVSQSLTPVLGDLAKIVGNVVKTQVESLIKTFEFLWYEVFKPITEWMKATFLPVFQVVGDGIRTAIQGYQTVFNGLITFIKGVFTSNWKQAWEGVRQIFKGVFDALIGIASAPLNFIKTVAIAAWEGIKSAWSVASVWFSETVVTPISNFFGGLWEGIKTGGGLLADFMKRNVIDPIVKLFKGLYNSVIGIVEGMINGFVGLINGFIRGINRALDVINKIPGVDLPSIRTLSAVSVPRLAKGGITNGPMMAMIGDNPGGKEVVSPLDDLVDIIASAVGSAVMNAMQFSGPGSDQGGDTVINVDSKELARATLNSMNKEAVRLGYKPILQTR